MFYLRLLGELITSIGKKRLPEAQSAYTNVFRVLPWDCNFQGTLNNEVVLSWIDICKLSLVFRLGYAHWLVRERLWTVTSALDAIFVRPVPVFAKVRVETAFVFWDEKYVYMKHRLLVKKELCINVLSRSAFVRGGAIVTPLEFMSKVGEPPRRLEAPESVLRWAEMRNALKNEGDDPVHHPETPTSAS